MAKRTERHVRKVKTALSTPAAKAAVDRVLELSERNSLIPSSAAAASAMSGYRPSGAAGSWGGSDTPDATGQIGTPGNLNMFGYISGEDYNPDLDGYPMFPNYNKMRLGDAQVNATLLMLKLPLKGAKWTIKPASEDPQDIAIADFVQASLFDDDALARSWQHVLDNALLKFDFGCSAEEIVWDLSPESTEASRSRVQEIVELARHGRVRELATVAENDGPVYVRVKDLAPRLPRTFYRWAEDPKTGKLAYLQQFAPKNGQYGYWNIPAANLTLHVRAREGNNYYGRSTLRTAYPHWWWKQQLYRIDMIGHDRFHVGIPRAVLDKDYNATSAPLDKIEATLKGLRSHDRAYMVQPFGVTYDVYGQHSQAGTSSSGILLSIEHHNMMIARNILQAFAAQGEQRHGSFGAAKVTADVYFDALEGEAEEIGSELKQAVIKRLCDDNFVMTGRKYPTVLCSGISAVDFTQLSESFSKLADSHLVTPDDDLEGWFRDLADAPGMPKELKGKDRSIPAPTPLAGPAAPTLNPKPASKQTIAAARRPAFIEKGRSFGRRPTALERHVLDLHGIPATLDRLQAALVREMAAVRRGQLQTLAHRIAQKDARPTAPFTDIRHTQIAMPGIAAMTKAIRVAQDEALTFGRESVQTELQKQTRKAASAVELVADNPTSAKNRRTVQSTLVSSAQITAKGQAESWRKVILDAALRLRRGGLQGETLEQKILDLLDEQVETGAKRDAAEEIHEAFGLGRSNAALEGKGEIEIATYSAILDANTCDTCEELDGEEFEIDSPEYEENLPPNAQCDGRDSCRCVYIYQVKEAADVAAGVDEEE